jgi:hypothetical protein
MAKASWILLLVVALAATVSTARALDSLPFIEMPLYVGEQRTALGIYEGRRNREVASPSRVAIFCFRLRLLSPEMQTSRKSVRGRVGMGSSRPGRLTCMCQCMPLLCLRVHICASVRLRVCQAPPPLSERA